VKIVVVPAPNLAEGVSSKELCLATAIIFKYQLLWMRGTLRMMNEMEKMRRAQPNGRRIKGYEEGWERCSVMEGMTMVLCFSAR